MRAARSTARRVLAAIAAPMLVASTAVAAIAIAAQAADAYTGSNNLGCRLYFGDTGTGQAPSTYTDTFTLTMAPASPTVGDVVTVTFGGAIGTLNGPVQLSPNTLTVVGEINLSGAQSGNVEVLSSTSTDNYPSPAAVAAHDADNNGKIDASAPLGAFTATGTFTASGAGTVTAALKQLKFDDGRYGTGSFANADTYCTDASAALSGGVDPKADPVVSTTIKQAATVAAAGAATEPGKPTGVSAVAGDGTALVSWTAPSSGGSPITGYTVTSSPGSKTCSTASTSCSVTGLTNGTAYTFTVVATNAIGDSPASNPSAAVTPSAPTEPDAPTGVSAVAKDASATVSWSAPADNGGSAISGYTATSSPDGKSCTASATTCTVTGLTNGTAYTFTVVATNGVGDSAASTPSAAVTPLASQSPSPTPTPTATGVSGSLMCTTLGQTQPWTATWSASLTGAKINVAFLPGPANGPVPLNDKWLKATAQITTPSTVSVEGAPYGALAARQIIPGTTMTGTVSGTPTTVGITKVVFKDIGSGSNVDTTCMPNTAINVPVLSSPVLPDTLPTSTGELTVNPSTVAAGAKVTLSGEGFGAGTNATAGMYSTPVTLGVGTANAQGAISVDVTIPSGTTGSHTLILLGTDASGGVVALTKVVTVTASTSTPTPTDTSTTDPTDDPDNPGTLPQTGPGDFTMTLVWALVALQVGLIVAVRASRSRRPDAAGKHRR